MEIVFSEASASAAGAGASGYLSAACERSAGRYSVFVSLRDETRAAGDRAA